MSTVYQVFESTSLNAVVTGFSFAAAISWMDVIRWIVSNMIKINKTSGAYVGMTALLTTLIAIVVYLALKGISSNVREPSVPTYAVR